MKMLEFIPIDTPAIEDGGLYDMVAEILSDRADLEEDEAPSPDQCVPRIPKVFKCDVRWSYMSMFVNALNSGDLFLAYSFLKTFTNPDFVQRVHNTGPSTVYPPVCGIVEFTKNWCVTTLTAPDNVIRLHNVSVQSFPDGSSVVGAMMTVSRTFLNDKPDLSGVGTNLLEDMGDRGPTTGAKRKVPMAWALSSEQSNLRALGIDLKPRKFEKTRRIRASRFSADLSDRECEFLRDLEATEPGPPKPLAMVRSVLQTGLQTMTLDVNKRIVAIDFVVCDQQFGAVEV